MLEDFITFLYVLNSILLVILLIMSFLTFKKIKELSNDNFCDVSLTQKSSNQKSSNQTSLTQTSSTKPMKNVDEYTDKIFDTAQRIKYYLGNVVSPMFITLYDKKFENKDTFIINNHFFDDDDKTDNPTIKNYINDMKAYYNAFKKKYISNDKKFILVTGDVVHTREDIAFISKTRPIHKETGDFYKKPNYGKNVLLPLNNIRHWKPVSDVKMYDIPYDSKKNTIVWRGASTGRDSRSVFVEKYYNYPPNQIDVGFTSFMEYYKGDKNPAYLKGNLTMKEQLQNKFLVSIEGNDVASNLKWVLASNSLCIMPIPKIESWLMEGLLVPWTHFVPFDVYDSLEETYDWCIKNPEMCKQIIKNANLFISKFMDGENEFKVITGVMKGYADKITIF